MRISQDESSNLVNSISSFRPDSEIYLFGSRVEDAKKGGDIDILIIDTEPLTPSERARIEWAFWEQFGPQKIDLVSFRPDSDDPFKRIALKKAIKLN